jgi:hypothetical protein
MGKNYRRIEQLKAIAFDCGFGNEDAKQFGKLSKTATWEAMLETYGVPFPVDNSSLDTDRRHRRHRRKRLMKTWAGGGAGFMARPPGRDIQI